MWKVVNDRLVHTTDESRITVQIRVDKDLLKELDLLSKKHNSTISYLIENGLEYMLSNDIYPIDKSNNIRNRTEFRIGIDKNLYDEMMFNLKERKIKRSDMIENSINYIQFDTIKNKNWRNRIEK